MPLTGFTCPPGTPENAHQRPGQRNAIEHCLHGCPSPCVAPPLLAKIHHLEQANEHKGGYISASMLANDTSCARQTWYERQPNIQVYENPRRRFWPMRGTIVHGLIEGMQDVVGPYGWLQELKMRVDLTYPELPQPIFAPDGSFTGDFDHEAPLVIPVGGTTDCVNPWRRWLLDFKSTGDAKLQKFLEGQEGGALSSQVKDSWVWQTNIYAWLLSQTPVRPDDRAKESALGPLGATYPYPERLSIQLISMMELPLTGTTYVPLRSWREYEVADVPVLDPHAVEQKVRESALRWYSWLVLGTRPPVAERSQQWQCKSCPFNGDLLEEGPCHPSAG